MEDRNIEMFDTNNNGMEVVLLIGMLLVIVYILVHSINGVLKSEKNVEEVYAEKSIERIYADEAIDSANELIEDIDELVVMMNELNEYQQATENG